MWSEFVGSEIRGCAGGAIGAGPSLVLLFRFRLSFAYFVSSTEVWVRLERGERQRELPRRDACGAMKPRMSAGWGNAVKNPALLQSLIVPKLSRMYFTGR